MGAWFKRALAEMGLPPSWIAPSAWFFRENPAIPRMETLADFQRCAREVQRGHLLEDIAGILKQCDAVLLNGENFLRPGTLKGRRLLFLAYLTKTVFRKPCILTNHSIDLREPGLVELLKEIYPTLDEVHFRENDSAEAAAPMLPPGGWKIIPDVAFAVPAAPLKEWADLGCRDGQFSAWPDFAGGFDPRKKYVTVCASSIFVLSENRSKDPVPAFIDLCRRLNEEVAPVVLSAPCEIDTQIMRRVQAATGFPLLGPHLPVRQAIDIIGNAVVHVGGRWHPGIFAATGGTPMVALSANTRKVHSLVQQLGMNTPVFDALALGDHIEAIVEQAKAHVTAGAPLRHRLQERSRELATQVGHNLDWFRTRIGRA